MTFVLFVTGVTWPQFPPSSSVFVHYSWKFTPVNKSSNIQLGFFTWRDWANHHRFLAACNKSKAKHWVPSHLHLSGSWWHKLVPVQTDLLQGAALGDVTVGRGAVWSGYVFWSLCWVRCDSKPNMSVIITVVFLAHLKIPLFKKQTSKCHFQMRPAKIEHVGDGIQSSMFVLSHCRYPLLQSSSAS